jgi:predicted transport protein
MEIFGNAPPPINRPQFENHLERLSEPARAAMVDLRKFVFSLGSNVIEEVKPHRVAYAKTMNFRIFVDIEPAGDSLVLSIKAGRISRPEIANVKTTQDIENLKKQIAEAYQKIQ